MQARGREAMRVRVQKYEGNIPVELRKFSIDPQITSLQELRSILITAFDLKEDFTLCYRNISDLGHEEYYSLYSNDDLDSAFLRVQSMSSRKSEPCIHLRVYMRKTLDLANRPKMEAKISGQRSPSSNDPTPTQSADLKQLQMGFQGMIMNHMEKTINLVSRALNLSEDTDAPPRPPLSQAEFLSFLSPVGHVQQGSKLREVIYNGGIDPSCRKVIWKHILNVYPDGLSGKERLDYMKRKSIEYYSLRDIWKECLQKEQLPSELAYVTNMVRKDVLRTDRHHKFYSGNDDNQNITSLFNILTTYSLNHPIVSYCQGMSDLASPLLVVMCNEAHAYICLCALMKRLYPNFLLDGEAMTLKFSHLSEALQVYDPVFYAYLQNQQADDLLFCYRWLLLEMKREFAFDDALHMLEVLWSSLPHTPPVDEISLKDKEFCPETFSEDVTDTPISPATKTPRENVYTKLCAIRRQSSSYNLTAAPKGKMIYQRMNLSFDENIGKENCIPQFQISKEFQSLDETSIECLRSPDNDSTEILEESLNNVSSTSLQEDDIFIPVSKHNNDVDQSKKIIKNLSEFNNFTVNKKKISYSEQSESITSIDESDVSQIESSSKSNGVDQINFHEKYSDGVFIWENPLHDTDVKKNNFSEFTKLKLKAAEVDNIPSEANQKNILSNKDVKLVLPSRDGLKTNSNFFSNMSQELENAKKNCEVLLANKRCANLQNIASTITNFQKKYELNNTVDNVINTCEEVNEGNATKPLSVLLPPSKIFGGGNPFLIFLALTLLMQHRDNIMRSNMDYNELAMYFDKMVRKHNVHRVLNQARRMFSTYIREQHENS